MSTSATMSDTATRAISNAATAPEAVFPKAAAQTIDWPVPPYYSMQDANSTPATPTCVVHMRTGSKLHGILMQFSPQDSSLKLRPSMSAPEQTIPLGLVKSLWIEQPVEMQPQDNNLETHARQVFLPSERQYFKIEFKDHQVMSGETVGYVNAANGLFLYLPEDNGKVVRWFIPVSATSKQSIGRLLGELLVEEKMASPAEIGAALAQQHDLRSQRIGDVLTENRILTREQLQKAISKQKSMPVLKLGEALLQLGLVTKEQLEHALAQQHKNRKTPLGKILVDAGVVDESALNAVLSKRLGIPFVSLQKFTFDASAIDMVDYAYARKHVLIPLLNNPNGLVVAFENPLANAVMEELQFITGRRIIPAVASRDEILAAINTEYGSFGSRKSRPASAERDDYQYHKTLDVDFEDLTERLAMEEAAVEDGPVEMLDSDSTLVQLVNKMILDAHAEGVSDIHIESMPENQSTRLRFRKDGTLALYNEFPANYRNALVSRIKIMAQLDITNHRTSQDGKIDFRKFGGTNIELRVVTIPTANGLEDVVMRVLAASKPKSLNELHLSTDMLGVLKGLVTKPYGLVLVCGPTGSGKTTTLHSLLSHINTADRKIWTVEDPVEITQRGLRQVQVNADYGMTFATAMRCLLRADPDVIMLGEMRDEETASAGIEASLTGHLVLSTLHTNGALESAVRLLDMGMDPFNFADALLGILAQRLAKTFCMQCREPYQPTSEELDLLATEYCAGSNLAPALIRQQWEADAVDGRITLWHGKGCAHCSQTGYRGRVGIYELLYVTPAIKRLIQSRAPLAEMQATAYAEGIRTLKQDGINKVLMGLTDITHVRAVCA